MKKTLLAVAALLFNMAVYAQIEKPVTWSYAAKKTSAN